MGITKLSIIIVTFNSENYILKCINSINLICTEINYEIIVVDNNSKDNTIRLLNDNFNGVQVIKKQTNSGFAHANNIGVRKSMGKYILLLNHDTVLIENILPALKIIEKNESIGALGIKMLNQNQKYLLSVGKFPKPWSLLKFSFLNNISNEFKSGQFNNPNQLRKVDWITGAFLLTKREYWDSVNGLDEDYFMYVEDVDFCKKLRKINKDTYFLPSYSFIHFVGFNKNREKLLIKGYSIFVDKHFKGFDRTIAKASIKINYVYKKIFKGLY